MVTKSKYGDESVYFDLNDVENTAGAWDMYGVDSSKRYPDQQSEFFERAADGLARREAMLGFLAIGKWSVGCNCGSFNNLYKTTYLYSSPRVAHHLSTRESIFLAVAPNARRVQP
jgi:hypothetical protein